MFLSVFDLFKSGIGPSSSHTVGPMIAAGAFLDSLTGDIHHIKVSLHGSLAFTGKGHGTDRAIVLGLHGHDPDHIDPDEVEDILMHAEKDKMLAHSHLGMIHFDPHVDIVFDYGPALSLHSNGMIFRAFDAAENCVAENIYYSIGGGFIATKTELENRRSQGEMDKDKNKEESYVPFPFVNAAIMLEMGEKNQLSIVAMKRANECVFLSEDVLNERLDGLWNAMNSCMNRGLSCEGQLPGGLMVRRRAAEIYNKLMAEHCSNAIQPHRVMDWLSVYAMAVNEENAAGGRVVTAPTNGAAGVIPAVIRYYLDHCLGADAVVGVRTFLLVAASIGGIIKHNASISGAEVGCQGEVGSASAMAAAGLCAALGGTNQQVENAAEIALEHHLGMTCDPIGGLVQVPCIERNALGAVKAVTASSLALRGDGKHFVPLDNCIETMRQTGLDMSENYKETSTGGLAVNVVEC